eukprot:13778227-Alexandrium_andersonii.AAC.1
MSASLVGSEMCIRDRVPPLRHVPSLQETTGGMRWRAGTGRGRSLPCTQPTCASRTLACTSESPA